MPLILMEDEGGSIVLPDALLCDRTDGGHLVVNPPRPVWERSELDPQELVAWSFLVAAAGRAMLEVLPVLKDGCLNYWEAGNWALNDAAEPCGPKDVRRHRRVHLHLLGRSRHASRRAWQWGESPIFPSYAESVQAAATLAPLTPSERDACVSRTRELLTERYRHQPCGPSA